jgi:hypothetical protein
VNSGFSISRNIQARLSLALFLQNAKTLEDHQERSTHIRCDGHPQRCYTCGSETQEQDLLTKCKTMFCRITRSAKRPIAMASGSLLRSLYTLDRSPAVGVMQEASLSTLIRIGRRLASEVDTEVQVFE